MSSSRTSFICNALCVFVIVATSNNKIDETQRPKNHASLLSFEWFTITGSIRFNLCINFKLWKNNIFWKCQNILKCRLKLLLWKVNSSLINFEWIFFLKKSVQKFDFFENFIIIKSVEFEVELRMSLIAKNWWLFSGDSSYQYVLPKNSSLCQQIRQSKQQTWLPFNITLSI